MISRVGGSEVWSVWFFLLLHSLAGARDRRREKCGIRSGYDDRLFSHSPCTTCEGYHQGASVAGLLDTGHTERFSQTKSCTPTATCTVRTRAQITHVVIGKHQPLTRKKVRGSDRHGGGPTAPKSWWTRPRL